MITEITARQIACAHAEIRAANELLEIITKADRNVEEPDLRDHFGRRRGLQLGVPSGDNSHRLFNVSHKLAAIVIRAHILEKQGEIAALCEAARLEMEAAAP